MKNPEEILKIFDRWCTPTGEFTSEFVISVEDCIKAMKLYANKKLDEAADTGSVKMTYQPPVGQKYMWNHKTDCHYSVKKDSILILKDEL